VHVVEALVDFRKCAVVSNIFINLELALQVVWTVDYGFESVNKKD
jgi:hypothetical protein